MSFPMLGGILTLWAQQVVGIDISPHMKPDETPENLWLQVDDLNSSFTFRPNRFDLVQSRLVAGGINRARWPTYMQDIVRYVDRSQHRLFGVKRAQSSYRGSRFWYRRD
ncbi:MAG: hypothetical protein M1839_001596 [Geoglossum umbratile]|nr:MAG: hypothetical protein M1839_001596 [Geoglossum umbratile]